MDGIWWQVKKIEVMQNFRYTVQVKLYAQKKDFPKEYFQNISAPFLNKINYTETRFCGFLNCFIVTAQLLNEEKKF